MRVSVRLSSLALIALLTYGRASWAGDLLADTQAGTKLLQEGDRLADEGKPGDAVLRYKNGFEKILPGLRQIPF